MKIGAIVHAISSGMLWPVGVALWPGLSRYLIAHQIIAPTMAMKRTTLTQ